jgi:Phosphotransferase enzyme family
LTALVTAPVTDALAILREALPIVKSLPAHLVHSDGGPDNVLIDGDKVAVIDFTPYHEPAMFSLGVALCWYFIHGRPEGADVAGVRSRTRPTPHFAPGASRTCRCSRRAGHGAEGVAAVPLALVDADGERIPAKQWLATRQSNPSLQPFPG